MNYGTLFDYIYKLDTYVFQKKIIIYAKNILLIENKYFEMIFFKNRKVIRLITFLQK